MAIGKKTGGRDFKPGQVANPEGRKKLSPEEKTLRELTKVEVARLLNLVSHLTESEMAEKWKDEKTPAIEKLFIKTILDGLSKGDSIRSCEFILNRTIGQVVEQVQVDGPIPLIIRKRDGEEIHLTSQSEQEDES